MSDQLVDTRKAIYNHIIDEFDSHCKLLLTTKKFYDMYVDEEMKMIEGFADKKTELIADAFNKSQKAILSNCSDDELIAMDKMMFSGINYYLDVNPEDPDANLHIIIYNRK